MSKIRVPLCAAQLSSVEQLMRSTTNKFEALRCRILLLLSRGLGVAEVARRAGCVRATVYRTVYRVEELGEDGLLDQRGRRAPLKATPEVVDHVMAYLDCAPQDLGWQRSTWTLELLAAQLTQDTGVQLSPSHLWRLLKEQGCRRGRPRPALRIPVQGRRAILDAIAERVAHACPEEEVVYVDEADIDLNPRIGLTYLKPGQQPFVLTPGKNVKHYVAAALNPRTGTLVWLDGPSKNSTLFINLLHRLSFSYRRSRVIHVVLDNYIIHKSRRTRDAIDRMNGRIQLHFLPPYSPESNPVERLWKQMHDHVTRNHRRTSMDALLADVNRFLDAAQPFPGTKVSTLKANLECVSALGKAI